MMVFYKKNHVIIMSHKQCLKHFIMKIKHQKINQNNLIKIIQMFKQYLCQTNFLKKKQQKLLKLSKIFNKNPTQLTKKLQIIAKIMDYNYNEDF